MEERALRNLREDILHAHQQLVKWRMDGNADRIRFWRDRMDELLDRHPRVSQVVANPVSTAIQPLNTVS